MFTVTMYRFHSQGVNDFKEIREKYDICDMDRNHDGTIGELWNIFEDEESMRQRYGVTYSKLKLWKGR